MLYTRENELHMDSAALHDACISVPQLIVIGAAGRNSGKTVLACEVIAALSKHCPVYALKIIGIDRVGEQCHRGHAGCGICTSLTGEYQLIEESAADTGKDTARMLQSGAKRAFLLKSLKSCMRTAFLDFLSTVPKGTLIVCESNTLRLFVKPGVFLFAHTPGGSMKPSARAVAGYADHVLMPGEAASPLLCLRQDADGSIAALPASLQYC